MAHDQLVVGNGAARENGHQGVVVKKGSGSGSYKTVHSDGSSESAKSKSGQDGRRRKRSSKSDTP